MSVLRLIPPKGEAIVVDVDEALVGREANCNVLVPHPSVSRRHALIKRKQDVFFLVDQGSANGTFVDSKRIVDATLKDGAVLRFGSASFKVQVEDALPVESVTEDELVLASTLAGSPSHPPAARSRSALADVTAAPHQGTPVSQTREEEPAPTVENPVLRPPKVAEPRPTPAKIEPVPPLAPVTASPPSRSPAFWLMIAAAALALLLVGAALGLIAAFFARRVGWI